VLSVLLFTSFGAKVAAFDEFYAVIAGSKLEIPDSSTVIIAYVVLATEFLCGLGLLFRRLAFPLYLGAGLGGMLLGYNVWRIIANVGVPCHCFGRIFHLRPFGMIALDLFIVGVSVALLAVDAPVR